MREGERERGEGEADRLGWLGCDPLCDRLMARPACALSPGSAAVPASLLPFFDSTSSTSEYPPRQLCSLSLILIPTPALARLCLVPVLDSSKPLKSRPEVGVLDRVWQADRLSFPGNRPKLRHCLAEPKPREPLPRYRTNKKHGRLWMLNLARASHHAPRPPQQGRNLFTKKITPPSRIGTSTLKS